MKKLFAILIMCFLVLPVFSIEGQEDGGVPVNNETAESVQETSQATAPEINEELKPVPVTASPIKYKKPAGKKKLAKKFIIAMLCVAGTSIFLYASLNLYNKLREGVLNIQALNSDDGDGQLETPSDMVDAVKTFIEKTHWEN